MPSVSPRSFSVDFIAAVAKRLLLSRLNCRCGFLFLGQVPALARIIQRPGRKIVEWGVSLLFLNLDSNSDDFYADLTTLDLYNFPPSQTCPGFFADRRIQSLLLPACAFTTIGFLAHKEWRLTYVVPILEMPNI